MMCGLYSGEMDKNSSDSAVFRISATIKSPLAITISMLGKIIPLKNTMERNVGDFLKPFQSSVLVVESAI